jgi:hypothetical protein
MIFVELRESEIQNKNKLMLKKEAFALCVVSNGMQIEDM